MKVLRQKKKAYYIWPKLQNRPLAFACDWKNPSQQEFQAFVNLTKQDLMSFWVLPALMTMKQFDWSIKK